MKRILLTGAAGGVGGMIRPLMRADYRLRLSDRRPIPELGPEEEEVPAELADLAAVRKAVAGVDGIVHLGGFPLEADWEVIHASNITGCYNLFEAARLEGVKRIVFASSNHAVGFYPRQVKLGHDVTPRPDTRYGLS
jgi:uronate dehydrogenase